MPVWALALLLTTTVIAGAAGGQAAIAVREYARSYGQHSAVNAESSVAETLTRAARGDGPPPGWQPPSGADVTEELPAVTTNPGPVRIPEEWDTSRDVVARLAAGLRNI